MTIRYISFVVTRVITWYSIHYTKLYDWWHTGNGAFYHSYEYDEQGKEHGPHIWDLEDGQKRARGQFESYNFV